MTFDGSEAPLSVMLDDPMADQFLRLSRRSVLKAAMFGGTSAALLGACGPSNPTASTAPGASTATASSAVTEDAQ